MKYICEKYIRFVVSIVKSKYKQNHMLSLTLLVFGLALLVLNVFLLLKYINSLPERINKVLLGKRAQTPY